MAEVIDRKSSISAKGSRARKRKRLHDIDRLLKYLWSFKLTTEGKILVIGGAAISGVAVRSVEIHIHYLLTPLFLTGFAALLTGYLYRPRLFISGSIPSRVGAGETFRTIWEVRNLSKKITAYDVSISLLNLPVGITCLTEPPRIPVLRPDEHVTLTLSLLAEKRGHYVIPGCRAFILFPFGICRSGKAKTHESVLLVTPAPAPIELPDIQVSRRYQPGGIAFSSMTGESMEYTGNREYRDGDSYRMIDFRGWARLAKPVVKEYLEEYYCRIALVMDTEAAPLPLKLNSLMKWVRGGGVMERKNRFEAAVSLTAAITNALSMGEYLIDIFAAGSRLYVFRAGRHTDHMERVFDILAGIDSSPTNPFPAAIPAIADELYGISTIIFVLTQWDEHRLTLARMACEAKCRVSIFYLANAGELTPDYLDPFVDVYVISPDDYSLISAEVL